MHGLEALSAEPSNCEIDIEAYEMALREKLAISGQSILRHAARMMTKAEGMADKIDRYKEIDEAGTAHWDRAPVAPDLPLYQNWLRQATILRLKHEQGEVQEPLATDRDLVALLARLEPLYEEAYSYYYGQA